MRFVAIAAVAVLAACGSDVASNPNGEISIAGSWRVTETVTQENCGDGLGTYQYNLSVSQNGTAIQVTQDGDTYNGTLNGNRLQWTGQINEDGGVTTANLDVTFSGNTFTGTSTWSWTDGNFTCTGVSTVSGTKN